MHSFDIAIIGGGINGCGIARDASGRGLKVYLCEQNDLASGTSQAATKLIHGGLRYLEYCEFRLVREALLEREVLWRMAPHIVRPLRFVLPHHPGLRPAWLLRLGLFLYDHLGGRALLPGTRTVDLYSGPIGKPLRPGLFKRGFEYSDCWVDDARLVALNARDAADHGAAIAPRTRAVSAKCHDGGWLLTTEESGSTRRSTIEARVLVNAAGPWVSQVLRETIGVNETTSVRLVQGSHIVVPRLFDHERCYIFQNADKRIVFAIPYENHFTLIGTTDRDYAGDPGEAKATPEEIAYLCEAANAYFETPITPGEVVWSYSGVRPLYNDGAESAQAATRDYVLKLDQSSGAPLLSIFGGKITTYRRLAEHALEKLESALPQAGRPWTRAAPLPGGDFAIDGYEARVEALRLGYSFLTESHARRLVRLYGTRAANILADAKAMDDLGQHFGATLTEAEICYLMREEWAQTVQDVIWRRTKLGLQSAEMNLVALETFMKHEMTARELASEQAA